MKVVTVILLAILLILSMPSTYLYNTPITVKGMASWYSEHDPGVLETTANMDTFDDSKFTCAMWGMPFNTILKVTNLENGKFVYVRVNDRGPAKRLVQEGRVIDLTKKAFSYINSLEKGLCQVRIEII